MKVPLSFWITLGLAMPISNLAGCYLMRARLEANPRNWLDAAGERTWFQLTAVTLCFLATRLWK